MRRGYKFKHRKYIRYFIFANIIFGFILAALAFGSIGIRLARPDIPEPVQCERSNIYPECIPDRMPKDYIRECWKGSPPCTLGAEVETSEYERSNINPACNPDRMSKDYMRETWKGGNPCPLDTVNSKDYLLLPAQTLNLDMHPLQNEYR